METRFSPPAPHYVLSATAGFVGLVLILVHPSKETLLALTAVATVFGGLGMALGERLKNPPYSRQAPEGADGGIFLARPSAPNSPTVAGSPLRSGDGGTFPRRIGTISKVK